MRTMLPVTTTATANSAGDHREQQEEATVPVDWCPSLSALLLLCATGEWLRSEREWCRSASCSSTSPDDVLLHLLDSPKRMPNLRNQAAGEKIHPKHRAGQHRRGQRHAVFQARGHHLIDPQSRQRPAEPDHARHADDRLRDEIAQAQQIADPAGHGVSDRRQAPATKRSAPGRSSRRGTAWRPGR